MPSSLHIRIAWKERDRVTADVIEEARVGITMTPGGLITIPDHALKVWRAVRLA